MKYANEMIENMMKLDQRKAEGYKLVLMICLKMLENEGEDTGVKKITKIIKTVIILIIFLLVIARIFKEKIKKHSD